MNPQEIDNLRRGADGMESALEESTGLDSLSRRKVTYWALGTHALPSLNEYPILVLSGQTSCGKSTTLKIVKLFVRNPVSLVVRTSTPATIRDAFHIHPKNGETTAICEEADCAMNDDKNQLEGLVMGRYSRDTSQDRHNVRDPKQGNIVKEFKFFGATCLHRRLAWEDGANDNRSIVVRFTPVSRSFKRFDPVSLSSLTRIGGEAIKNLKLILSDFDLPGRIAGVYRPLLGVAALLGDTVFRDGMTIEAEQAAERLKESRQGEPGVLIVEALFAVLFGRDGSAGQAESYKSVTIADIRKHIWDYHHLLLAPRQISSQLRDLSLEVRISHGFTKAFPQPSTLLRAAVEIGYEDDAVDEIRKLLKGNVFKMMSTAAGRDG